MHQIIRRIDVGMAQFNQAQQQVGIAKALVLRAEPMKLSPQTCSRTLLIRVSLAGSSTPALTHSSNNGSARWASAQRSPPSQRALMLSSVASAAWLSSMSGATTGEWCRVAQDSGQRLSQRHRIRCRIGAKQLQDVVPQGLGKVGSSPAQP